MRETNENDVERYDTARGCSLNEFNCLRIIYRRDAQRGCLDNGTWWKSRNRLEIADVIRVPIVIARMLIVNQHKDGRR